MKAIRDPDLPSMAEATRQDISPLPAVDRIRVRSLDGLRGLAAGIVLLHHLSMTIPAISNGYEASNNIVPFSLAWWAVASPLKIFLAGPEFVLVFFVLSGFVLTLSPLSRPARASVNSPGPRAYDWVSYYPRRVLRLGIPVAASLALAVGVIILLPRPVHAGVGDWLARQSHPNIGVQRLIVEALLIVDPNRPRVNPSLWSLTWEMWFSLLLPVAVLLALWSRRAPALWALLFCGISMYGYTASIPAMMFLPAFGLGGLLGANAHRIHGALERWQHRRGYTPLWIVVAICGPLMSICFWMLRPLLSGPAAHLALAMRVPGAVIIVATVAFWPAAARLFEARPLIGLGRVSFSLYLVHAPIVIAFGLLFANRPWWIGATLTLITCAVVTVLMYVLVEKPSNVLASWTGAHASRVWTTISQRVRLRKIGVRTGH